MRVPNLHTAPKRHLIKIRIFLKPGFHMVVNVSRLCRKCRRDRVRVYLDDTCDTVATRSRPYGN